jgi:hypothetical protein
MNGEIVEKGLLAENYLIEDASHSPNIHFIGVKVVIVGVEDELRSAVALRAPSLVGNTGCN